MQGKLKSILYDRRISQKKLAAACGMTERSLSNKMRGEVDFTYTEVYNICAYIGIVNPLEVFEPKK